MNSKSGHAEKVINAVLDGDIRALRALCDESKEVANVKGVSGYFPIHIAVYRQDIDLISYLLGKGADANVIDDKSSETVVHIAAKLGDLSSFETLLPHCKIIDNKNIDGKTPLDLSLKEPTTDDIAFFGMFKGLERRHMDDDFLIELRRNRLRYAARLRSEIESREKNQDTIYRESLIEKTASTNRMHRILRVTPKTVEREFSTISCYPLKRDVKSWSVDDIHRYRSDQLRVDEITRKLFSIEFVNKVLHAGQRMVTNLRVQTFQANRTIKRGL